MKVTDSDLHTDSTYGKRHGRRMTRTKHDLRSEATRRRLVTAARALFGARGFAEVGTEEIAGAAGAEAAADPVGALRSGARLFLDACAAPEVERIILLDAPAVLGWQAWRDLAGRYGLGLVQFGLQSAIEAGALVPQPVGPLAHVLIGALNESALYVARAKDPAKLRSYFGELFGWEFDTSSPVAEAVSEPDDYGFVNRSTTSDGTGIPGGVGGGAGYPAHAMFYVGVADVEAALQRAERLGGTRQMGPGQAPTGLVVGHFTDPEGNLIGIAGTA